MANALLGTFQANPEQLESFALQRGRSSDEVEGLGISQRSDDAVVGNRGQIVEQGTEAVHTLARRKRTASGERVHSFRTLLDDLATVANNRVVAPLADAKPFDLITRPTALQRKAFKLLGVCLERTQ